MKPTCYDYRKLELENCAYFRKPCLSNGPYTPLPAGWYRQNQWLGRNAIAAINKLAEMGV